jgi:quercetin dioxygenase-like cupin family protein
MNASRWIGLVLPFSIVGVAAQVPVNQDPTHRVRFENLALRILDVNIPAGEASVDHRHEFDIATVSMTSGTDTRLHTAGTPAAEARPARPLGHAMVVEHAGRPTSHRVENVGRTTYRLFAVENLKKNGWSTTAPASGRATTLTSESRGFRIYDVRLGRDATQTSHRHAATTVAVLMTGAVMSDGPDKQAKAYPAAPVGLKQLTEPGEWILVPAGDTHHVVRLGENDARVVEIEVR